MKVIGWLKAALAVALGLVIGLLITGLLNLLVPDVTIGWTLAAALVASALSALAGFAIAGPRKRPQAPAAGKDAGAGAPKR